MIPDYQTLMRPVLETAENGEVRISDVVEQLADHFKLSADERIQLLPSGKQTTFSNRVHWAKGYLKQAGLVKVTRRAHFEITERGREALADPAVEINNQFLKQFDEFKEFQDRTRGSKDECEQDITDTEDNATPDEILRAAYKKILGTLSTDLLDRVRNITPAFFEQLIIELLLAMGYGGAAEDAGRALGKSGDNGIDGVIDQDPLGVDQIYIQAKRNAVDNPVGSGAIRDFFGALNLKKAQKGIFITTSSFTPSATKTAKDLGSRIVLIDGEHLSRLMIRYNIGCRDEEIMHIKKVDEDFFD